MPKPEVIEDMELEYKRMHLCLDKARLLAELLHTHVGKIEGGLVLSIPRDSISAVFQDPPLPRRRLEWVYLKLGETLANSLESNGIAPCQVWELAHNLHHILYDEDVPSLPHSA